MLQVVDVADAVGYPRMNEWHRKMRQGVVSVLVCSGRQEVVSSRRNRLWTSSEQRVLGEKLGRPGGVIWGEDRGETERRGERFKVRGQGALITRH